MLIYYFYKNKVSIRNKKDNRMFTKTSSIIIKLIKIALPITLGASVFSITSLIDLSMTMRRLRDIGFSETIAIKLYGYLTGYAYKIYSLPITVIIALCVSIVPLIAANYVNKNKNKVIRILHTAFKTTFIVSMPAAIGIAVLSKPILELLFRDSNAYKMLSLLSIAIVFASTVQVSGAVLQAVGKVMTPVKNLLIGATIKILINYVLIGIPAINILGAPIGTAVSFMLVTALNFSDISKVLKTKLEIYRIFLKPLIASIIMGGIVSLVYHSVMKAVNVNAAATLIAIIMGMITYSISLIILGGVKQEDINVLPFRSKILKSFIKE
jgi:stage V sporulation protein B